MSILTTYDDRTAFYATIRKALFSGKLLQSQVNGINALIDGFFAVDLTDMRWLAYMMATSYHETGRKMVPVRECFATTDKAARACVARRSYGKPAGPYKHVYYGRGIVQLTWESNYKEMGRILKLPLHANPDLALIPAISTRILIEGMTTGVSMRGDFTGRHLGQYFNSITTDWYNARRIINGVDKARLIQGYAVTFYNALIGAK